jgi:hypothetical protein
MAALPATAPVSAKCITPPLEPLWSYPADGAVDVPTNAVFWSLNKYALANPVLTLNGVPVPSTPWGPGRARAPGIPLGTLEPQHDYVIRLEFPQPTLSDGGTTQPIEIAFRTGDGPAERLAPVDVTGDRQTPDGPDFRLAFLEAECAEEIRAQGCFDTGPNTLIHFEVSEAAAIGFVVAGKLWPARCGSPAVYEPLFSVPEGDQFCVDVQAIGPGGLITEPTQYCATVETSLVRRADSGAGRTDSRVGGSDSEQDDLTSPSGAQPTASSGGCVIQRAGSETASGALGLLVALAALLMKRRSYTG